MERHLSRSCWNDLFDNLKCSPCFKQLESFVIAFHLQEKRAVDPGEYSAMETVQRLVAVLDKLPYGKLMYYGYRKFSSITEPDSHDTLTPTLQIADTVPFDPNPRDLVRRQA